MTTTWHVVLSDVITIEKTKEYFRLLYDTKGRFVPHKIHPDEATYKLCRIKRVEVGLRGVPIAVTHDGRTLRYVHPDIKVHDVVRFDLSTGKILDFVKFEVGKKVIVTGGHNTGRVGTIISREKHPGSVEIVHIKDVRGQTFATRVGNTFMIGTDEKFWISLPKDAGVKKSIIEDRNVRLGHSH